MSLESKFNRPEHLKGQPCRVTRFAVVKIESEIIYADDPDLALLALDRLTKYDQLLSRKIGRKMIANIELAYMQGAEIESIDLDSMIGMTEASLSESQIEALGKKYNPGRRVSKPSSGGPVPCGTGSTPKKK